MHGILFLALEDFLESQLGDDAWSRTMAAANLDDEDFSPDLFYPDGNAQALFDAAAKLLNTSPGAMLERLGHHMSPGLVAMGRSMGLVKPHWKTMDILEHLQKDILSAFGNPDADRIPPDIRTYRLKHGEVAIAYLSRRKLCYLLKGIVRGMGDCFDEPIAVKEWVCQHNPGPFCRLSVYLDDPLLQRYVDVQREFQIVHSRIEEIGIFNQFKGTPVNFSGLVLRFSREDVLIQTHREQLVAMQEEGVTYIAVPHLPLGLEATVKEANLAQGTALLHRISLTDGPVGKRRYQRVTPESPLAISLQVEKKLFRGHISNLSGGGVSLVLDKNAQLEALILFANVTVRFSLPLPWIEFGDTIELGPQETKLTGNILDIREQESGHGIRIVFSPLPERDLYVVEKYYKKQFEEADKILKNLSLS